MNKIFLLAVLIIILILIIAGWFYRSWLIELISEPVKNDIILNIKPEIKDVEIKETTDKYEIQITYPEFSGSNTDGFNKAIKDKVLKDISDFKEGVVELALPEIEEPSSLQIGYEIVLNNNEKASIKIDTYYHISGMAHPWGYYTSFNYDFKSNKAVELADLFNPGTDYLTELSNICREKLKQQIDPDYYSDDFVLVGTEPIIENYSVFNFTEDKLIITFNPDQIGPWALGPQVVEILFSELTNLWSL